MNENNGTLRLGRSSDSIFAFFSAPLSHMAGATPPNERTTSERQSKKKIGPFIHLWGSWKDHLVEQKKKTGFFRAPRIDKAAVPPLLLIPPQFYFERPAGRCITPTPATSRLDPRTPSCDVQGCGSRLPPNPNASPAEPT